MTMPFFTDQYRKALLESFDLCKDDFRKGDGSPMYAHLMAVSSIVMANRGDEETCIAALFHDAVEDKGGAGVLEDIRRGYGERVAALVEACSDCMPVDKAVKPPWLERKAEHLSRYPELPPESWLILAADKWHNSHTMNRALRAEGNAFFDHFKGGKMGTLWYFSVSAFQLGALLPGALSDDLLHETDLMRNQVHVTMDDIGQWALERERELQRMPVILSKG